MTGKYLATFAALALLIAPLAGCNKFYIRNVDPEEAGRVRSLGPESQDVAAVSDLMIASLMANGFLKRHENPPVIHMEPMENNTRHAFNQEVFTTRLKASLNQNSEGRIVFRSGDLLDSVRAEREAKRDGQVDYDPEMRSETIIGADYFLKGRADGLTNVSTRGQSDTIYYSFKLVDAETAAEIWEDIYEVKKEGKDDVIYR